MSTRTTEGAVARDAPTTGDEERPRLRRGCGQAGAGLPEDFQPLKVVLAIPLKDGAELTADPLFPFSQVALVQTARTLEGWGVQVEVVGIASTPPVATLRDTVTAGAS